MKRRILAIVLTALMLLCMAPAAMAYMNADGTTEHDHQWQAVEGRVIPATCTEWGAHTEQCILCYETRTVDDPPLGHLWSEWQITTEPTCTEPGLKKRVCLRPGCEVEETGIADALGHKYSQSTVTRQPTCAQKGERRVSCSRCGKSFTESIDRTPHTWGAWTVVVEPGLWTKGREERTCSVCGAKDSRDTYMEGTVVPGERSENAKALQEALNAAGFDCGKADGIVGNKTTSAISAAEEAAGHPATGIGWVGLKNWLSGSSPDLPDLHDAFIIWVDAPVNSDAKAGEFIPTTLHIKNTGVTTLRITGHSYGDYAEGNVDYISGETIESKDPYGVLKPGEETTETYNVMVTDADVAAGQAVRQVSVACHRFENDDDVGESMGQYISFVIRLGESVLPLEPIDDFIIWIDAPTASGAKAGETIPTALHIKNTGNTTLRVTGSSYGTCTFDSDGKRITVEGETIDTSLFFSSDYTLAPGAEGIAVYNVMVTEAEEAAGQLSREAGIACHRFENGNDVGNSMARYVEFAIALGAAPEPGPVIGTPINATGIDVTFHEVVDINDPALGETVKTTLTIANVGDTTLNVTSYEMVDGEGNDRSDEGTLEWNYSSEPADARALKPGEHYFVDYYITVREEDVAAGKAYRTFTAYAVNDTGNAVSDSDAMNLPLLAATARDGGVALTLDGETQEYKDFYPNDTFSVTLTAENTGFQDLTGLVIEVFKEDAETFSETSLGEVYNGGSATILPAGGSVNASYVYEIKPEDAGKLVTLIFYAKALDATGAIVEAAPWSCEFEVEDGEEDWIVDLILEEHTPETTAKLGEVIDVPLSVTNKGTVVVDMETCSGTAHHWNQVMLGNDHILFDPDHGNLEPNETQNGYIYSVLVLPEDIDAGEVVREVRMGGYRCITTASGSPGYMRDEEGQTILFETNSVIIRIPLDDNQPNGSLLLEQNGPASQPDGALGEWISVPLKLTNTSDTSIYITQCYTWNPDDGWALDSGYVSEPNGGTGNADPLGPGLFFTCDLSIYVTQADVDAGEIKREVYFSGRHAQYAKVYEQSVNSNTVTITLPLRAVDDSAFIELELSAGPVSPVYAEVGDVLEAPLTLTNHGSAAARGVGLTYWYDSGDLAYADDVIIGSNFYWLEPNGGQDEQTYRAVVTQDDIDKGYVSRTIYESAFRWLVTNKDEAGEGACAIDDAVNSNEATIYIPLLSDPPRRTHGGEPELVLTMVQTSPVQAAYKSGQKIEYNWTLTNIGSADCDFGGLMMYFTNKEGNMVTADVLFYGVDSRVVLTAFGGSTKGTGSFILDASQILSDSFVVPAFYGQGYYPYSTEVWVYSNTVKFEYLIDDNTWTPDPTEVKVSIDKWEDSYSADPHGYVKNETVWYRVNVSNDGNVDLHNVVIEDPLYTDSEGGHVIAQFDTFAAGDYYYDYYAYVVTSDDVSRTYIENTAYITWDDPITGERVTKPSYPVNVPTYESTPVPPVKKGTLFVYKSETSTPANDFYQENEVITYNIVVLNDSNQTAYDIYVDDALVTGGNKSIAYIAQLASGASYTVPFSYIVTGPDCDNGSVTNTASIAWTDSDGHGHTATSNPVTSPTGWPKDKGGLVVTKAEISKPLNMSYYTEGEVIEYKIVAINTSDHLLTDVEVYDLLSDMGFVPLGTAELLHPSEARTYYFSHTVTAEDVNRGYVENFAVGFYTDENVYGFTESNHVFSDTNGEPEDHTGDPDGFPTPIAQGDYCYLTLNGKGAGTGDYTQHICAEHLPVAKQVDALVSAAADADARTMAWKTARALWQAKIDESYEILYAAALDMPTRLIVLNERMLFAAQADLYERELALIYPDDEETVAMRLAEMMMNKSAELCYEIHTAPADRVDSLLGSHVILADAADAEACARAILERSETDTRYIETLCSEHAATDKAVLEKVEATLTLAENERAEAFGKVFAEARKLWLAQLDAGVNERYRTVDSADRPLIAASRTTFGNWLHTREALLELLYPEKEAAVNEVLARTIMCRTIDGCIADADANAD
ncbi:MAG: peptidoglycan-binding protein [Clostridia bacterium]|nr:peptidoglycan-binding protein [Clostridia bacterium]